MNIMMLLEMAGGAFPDRPAFTDGSTGKSFTYGELFEAARHRAASVQSSGASRLVKLDVSNLGTPLGLFTAAWAGVPYVPLNYRLTDPEIEALLKRVLPAYLITDENRVGTLGGLDDVGAIETGAFVDPAGHPSAVEGEWSMDPEEIAVLLFTSGTTGVPKAAVLRHKHLVSYILSSVEFGAPAEDEAVARVRAAVSHRRHRGDLELGVLGGRTSCSCPTSAPRAGSSWRARRHVTHAFVVPTMLARIVDALEAARAGRRPPEPARALLRRRQDAAAA